MEPARYTDPLEEAVSHGSQRVAQFASLIAAMGQVVIQRRALRDAATASRNDEAIRVFQRQEEALRQESRMQWAPAHDREWLAEAGLIQTARAWAGASAFADTDSAASAAQRKCEDRLRVLHPYAMTRYDRLRADGLAPHDAMRDTAPLFAGASHVRTGYPGPTRRALAEHSSGPNDTEVANDRGEGDSSAELLARAERRGKQIVDNLQGRAMFNGRSALGADELAMILEAVTSLPDEVITKISGQVRGYPPGPEPQSAARLAAECFPHSVTEAVQTAVVHRSAEPATIASAVVHRSRGTAPPSVSA